ncbi:MAG: GNAT family N-acetyltransferase [bacterium]|nr:GNAT family N-acetyltransferase [bacterium]
MNIALETEIDWEEHDSFLSRARGATFYHTSTWLRGLEQNYGYRPGCLTWREGDHLRAVIPFLDSRKLGLIHRVSLPFGTYGGPAMAADLDPSAVNPLVAAFMDNLSGRVHRVSLFGAPQSGVVPTSDENGVEHQILQTQILDLRGGWEQVLATKIRKEKRRQMRKAERGGVQVERSTDPAAVAAYYEIYLEHVRDWGLSDPTPLAHLQQLVRDGERVRFWTARLEGEIIGGHFNLHFRRMIIAWNGTARKSCRQLAPSVALYAANLERACLDGDEYFNFGGSGVNDPLFDFKASFGAVPVEYRGLRLKSGLLTLVEKVRQLRSGS